MLRKIRQPSNESLHEKVLEGQVRCFGAGHVSCAMTLGNIALVHSALGQKEEAVDKRRQAHRTFLEKLGPDHPSTLLEARNLSRHCAGIRYTCNRFMLVQRRVVTSLV